MRARPDRWLLMALLASAIAAGAALGYRSDSSSAAAAASDWRLGAAGRQAALADQAPAAPAAVSVDSPGPTCYREVPETGACHIQWTYLLVQLDTTANYVISMSVSIDDHKRAYLSGFFQNYVYLPSDYFGPGFKVACGAPGASGDPNLGARYDYLLLARASDGSVGRSGGSITCPANLARQFLPVILDQ